MCNYGLLQFYADLKSNLGPVVVEELKDFPNYEKFDNMYDYANSVFRYGFHSGDLYVRTAIFNVLSAYGYNPYNPVYSMSVDLRRAHEA